MKSNVSKKIILIVAFVLINSTIAFATSIDAGLGVGTGPLVVVSEPDTSYTTTIIDSESDYNNLSKKIKADIDSYTEKIKKINDYNAEVSDKYDKLIEDYKHDKSIISDDTMRRLRETRRLIKADVKKEKTILESDSIKALVENKEYNKAIDKLLQILESKKEQLKVAEEKNEIWKEIDSMIGY